MVDIKLNKNQIEAINHVNGPMLVVAGPGSGKTMVITERVNQLINKHKVNPKEILIITFTKYAAKEMENRYIDKYDTKKEGKPNFGTFHSVFFRMLCDVYKYDVSNVIRDDEKYMIFKQIITKLNMEYEQEKEFINNITNEISMMKNELIDIKNYNPLTLSKDEFDKTYKYYELYKKKNQKIDFDDMLVWTYMLFKTDEKVVVRYRNKYKYILVDEFQDVNKVQFEILKLISEPLNNIFVVGDDDQSIYRFRGARPELFLKFSDIYKGTKKVFLDINYRCTEPIVKISNKLINNNCKRYCKALSAFKNEKVKPTIFNSENTSDEAEKIAKQVVELNKRGKINYKNIAVIFRTNMQARSFVEKFSETRIPFCLKDDMPDIYKHWVIRDVMSYIKASQNIEYNQSVAQIINRPNRYISKDNITKATNGKDLIDGLYHLQTIKKYQISKLDDLVYFLKTLKTKTIASGIRYIRKDIGYDLYLREYAGERKLNVADLFEILDEFEESMRGIKTYEEYVSHIEGIRLELEKNKRTADTDRVVLTTMHSAKGLEFDAVFVAGVAEGIVPHEKSTKSDYDIEEERRLMYVAMTRAKEHLYISTLGKRYEKKLETSRFIKEIQ